MSVKKAVKQGAAASSSTKKAAKDVLTAKKVSKESKKIVAEVEKEDKNVSDTEFNTTTEVYNSEEGVSGTKRSRPLEDDVEVGVELAPEMIPPPALPQGTVIYKNKQRILVFCSRGMTSRYRHLMEDIRALVPHHKTESKLDTKENLTAINDIAQSKSCNMTLYFECRKKRDLFLWLSNTPTGPSVKFHVVNVHTMDELRLTGNCLRGSRPILSFDRSFDDEESTPHLRLIREMLAITFATPRGHPKSQPFHDRVMSFGLVDGKVWIRNYQIVDKAADAKTAAKMLAIGEQPTVLVEIGPRLVLNPVRIFSNSMGGQTLWSNDKYLSPNSVRHAISLAKGQKYAHRKREEQEREFRAIDRVVPKNPVDDVFRE